MRKMISLEIDTGILFMMFVTAYSLIVVHISFQMLNESYPPFCYDFQLRWYSHERTASGAQELCHRHQV